MISKGPKRKNQKLTLTKIFHPWCMEGVATQAPLLRTCSTLSNSCTLGTTCCGDGGSMLEPQPQICLHSWRGLGKVGGVVMVATMVTGLATPPFVIQVLFMVRPQENSLTYVGRTHGGQFAPNEGCLSRRKASASSSNRTYLN